MKAREAARRPLRMGQIVEYRFVSTVFRVNHDQHPPAPAKDCITYPFINGCHDLTSFDIPGAPGIPGRRPGHQIFSVVAEKPGNQPWNITFKFNATARGGEARQENRVRKGLLAPRQNLARDVACHSARAHAGIERNGSALGEVRPAQLTDYDLVRPVPVAEQVGAKPAEDIV